jgi:[ribosomal protein S18]-alanine N-acetyltransferase
MIEAISGTGLDVAAIMPVMEDAFDSAFGEAWTAAQCLSTLSMPGSLLQIAKRRDEVVGFTLSRWVLDEEELLLIGVSRSARRQGVGRILVNRLMDEARSFQRASIFLEVRDGNSAQSFYHEMGFRPVGRRAGYYKAKDGSLFDSITMAMEI